MCDFNKVSFQKEPEKETEYIIASNTVALRVFSENELGKKLLEACRKGELLEVKRLVSEGAPVSWKNDIEQSAGMYGFQLFCKYRKWF